MLEAGTKAPVFSLPDKDGNMISLENYRGKRVVLYFTPGTTRRAAPGRPAPFAGAYEGFKQKDVVVIGVSKDSQTSHQKFAEKYNLPFILVSDPELTAIKAYDVWQEKSSTAR